MKIVLLVPHEICGEMFESGRMAIVSDEHGASLVRAGVALELGEGDLGGFAVPLQDTE